MRPNLGGANACLSLNTPIHVIRQITFQVVFDSFVGKSQTIRQILGEIRRLHKNDTVNVLITGESGTGKELVARAIHFGGSRSKRPFIPVNCSAIPLQLAESAFFGHVQGAFTGANTERRGYFEVASGGTLFLDEIGDMPPELQAQD